MDICKLDRLEISSRISRHYRLKSLISSLGLLGGALIGLSGCSLSPTGQTEAGITNAENTGPPGTLLVQANGEDFVRQGFTTKDGWQVNFDHVYVTLANVTASQTDPAFEPGKSRRLEAKQQVKSSAPVTVDLAAGGPDAEPVTAITFDTAPSGRYNALAWDVVAPTEGPAAGYTVVLIGTATQAAEQIPFQIQLSESLSFTCGDFIGDERKGFLNAGEQANVEATFHFDHFFGDGDAPADDEINTGALGFEPLAALATEGKLKVDSTMLKEQLSQEQYQTFQALLPSLGHVGEGHCEETQLSQ